MRCVAHATKITKINDVVCRYPLEDDTGSATSVSLKVFEEMYDVFKELEDVYQLMFSREVVISRMLELTHRFYLRNLAYLSKHEDLELACQYIYDTYEKFGFEHFEQMIEPIHIEIMERVKNKDFSYLIGKYLMERIEKDNKSARRTIREIRRKRRQERKQLMGEMSELESENHRLKSKKSAKLMTKIDTSTKGQNKVHTRETSIEDQGQDKTLQRFNQFVAKEATRNDYWVFQDRFDDARDNAEALYRYVMKNNIYNKIAFILDENSADYERLQLEGFHLIKAHSDEHWDMLRGAKYFLTSHCGVLDENPWLREIGFEAENRLKVKKEYQLIFLQHGVIRSNLARWLGQKKFYKIIASSKYERKSLLDIPGYRLNDNDVIASGQARFDYLERREACANTITVFPTWRSNFSKLLVEDEEKRRQKFVISEFYKNWSNFFSDEKVQNLLATGVKMRLLLHASLTDEALNFKEVVPDNVELVSYDKVGSFSEVVNNSSMLITDYSSFSFDFLYLDKPVLYFDFEKNAIKNNIRGMEYDRFGYYTTELGEAVKQLLGIVENKFIVDEKKRSNIDDVFINRSGNHCQLIVNEILASE